MSKVIRISDDLLEKLNMVKNELVEEDSDPVMKDIMSGWNESDIIGYLISYYKLREK